MLLLWGLTFWVSLFHVLAQQDGVREVTNRGTRFILTFMDNVVPRPSGEPVEIYVSTEEKNAWVCVSAPALSVPGRRTKDDFLVEKTIQGYRTEIFRLPILVRPTGVGVFPSAIVVESSSNITVFAFNYEQYSADSFLVMPVNALSTHYLAVTYGPAHLHTQIAVCASLPGETIVEITLPSASTNVPVVEADFQGLRYHADETIRVILVEYHCIHLQARTDLTGSQIISNKPVAAFSGNVRAFLDPKYIAESCAACSGSRDHLAVQLYPVSSYGQTFALGPAPNGLTQIYRVLSPTGGAVLTIHSTAGGAPDQWTIPTSRSFIEIEGVNSWAFLRSTVPVQVAVIFVSQVPKDPPGIGGFAYGDPSLSIVSPISSYASFPAIGVTRVAPLEMPGYTNDALVFIDEGQVSGLRCGPVREVSGTSQFINTTGWTSIPQTGLVGRLLPLNQYWYVLWHTSGNVPFYMHSRGVSDRESYSVVLNAKYSVGPCDLSVAVPGDGTDNDCDGSTDEESADQLDTDADGNIDEDTALKQGGHQTKKTSASGLEYVVAFMENDARREGVLVELYIASAPGTPKTVTFSVTTPRQQGDVEYVNKTVAPGSFTKVSYEYSQLIGRGSQRSDKTIRIVSDNNILVYALNRQKFSTDGSLAFATNRLGYAYYIICWSPAHLATEFVVIAVEDDTQVSMRLSDTTGEVNFEGTIYTAGQTISVTLAAYESVQIQSGRDLYYNDPVKGDLTGTHITTNGKRIAVFAGNARTHVRFIGSRDHLMEQLPPVPSYGRLFVLIPTPRRTLGESYRILASEDETEFTLYDKVANTATNHTIEKAGHIFQLDVNGANQSFLVMSNKPLMIVAFVLSQNGANSAEKADPAMTVIPAVNHYVSELSFATPQNLGYSHHYISIVIQCEKETGLRINGMLLDSITSGPWIRVDPASGSAPCYTYTQRVIEEGTGYTVSHIDSSVTYMAYLYGLADRESYGYLLGINLPITQEDVQTAPMDAIAKGEPGDGIDNDGDGRRDEELCDEIDDDGDGQIDEDCQGPVGPLRHYGVFLANEANYLRLSLEVRCVSHADHNVLEMVAEGVQLWDRESEFRQRAYLDAGESVVFALPMFYRMILNHRKNANDVTTEFKSIIVRSTLGVSCYGMNKELNSHDAFPFVDTGLLGTEFYAITWANRPVIGVMAVEKTTVVMYVFGGPVMYDNVNYTAGEPLLLDAEAGQTFQIRGSSDLTGTQIVCTPNPCAVYSGNIRSHAIALSAQGDSHSQGAEDKDRPVGPSQEGGENDHLIGSSQDEGDKDHLVDYCLPSSLAGTTFALAPSSNGESNTISIVATEDGTTVIRLTSGGDASQIVRLQRSGDHALVETTGLVRITASQPVIVGQFVHSRALPAVSSSPGGPSLLTVQPASPRGTVLPFWKTRYHVSLTRHSLTPMKSYAHSFAVVIVRCMTNADGNVIESECLSSFPTFFVGEERRLLLGPWSHREEFSFAMATRVVSQPGSENTLEGGSSYVVTNSLDVPFQLQVYGDASRESYSYSPFE